MEGCLGVGYGGYYVGRGSLRGSKAQWKVHNKLESGD